MLVFSGFSPHSPLLLPTIGRDNQDSIIKTKEALQYLSEEIYASHPDILIIITSHSRQLEKSFSIAVNDSYKVNFKEFGDLVTESIHRPDLSFVDRTQRYLRKRNIPLVLYSDDILDYGTSVPLHLLAGLLKNISIVPISVSGMSGKDHFDFGKEMKDCIKLTNKRIAVIASGDLAHTLSTKSPGGYKRAGKQFDTAIRNSVTEMSASKLLSIKPRLIEDAVECGYRQLAILMGIMDGMDVSSKELSYESPFGVGYLVAQCILHGRKI